MAKMFYTMDETQASLGKNEEEIKQFAREGRLREFRDGARLMFKADQVEHLKAELAGSGGDQIDLDHGESGAPIGLAGSNTGTGTGISLSSTGTGSGTMGTGSGTMGGTGSGMLGGTGSGMMGATGTMGGSGVIGLADTGSGTGSGMAMTPKDDTSLAADMGLTGSLGGIPSPGKTGTGMGTFAGKSGTASGITIFGGEDAERADPSAQTAMSSGTVQDQVNLDGVGSGSGLLDLTRESDDTSLGAELDDRGGGRRGMGAGDTRESGLSGVGEAAGGRVISQPNYVEAEDAMAPAFGGAAFGTAAVLLFAAFVLISAVFGYSPTIIATLAKYGLWMLSLGGLVVVIICFLVGLVVGKSSRR